MREVEVGDPAVGAFIKLVAEDGRRVKSCLARGVVERLRGNEKESFVAFDRAANQPAEDITLVPKSCIPDGFVTRFKPNVRN